MYMKIFAGYKFCQAQISLYCRDFGRKFFANAVKVAISSMHRTIISMIPTRALQSTYPTCCICILHWQTLIRAAAAATHMNLLTIFICIIFYAWAEMALSIGVATVANKKVLFWRSWTVSINLKDTEASFLPNLIDSLCLQVAQMPRSPDLALLCLRQMTDTTDYFTPAVHARVR